MSKETLLKRLYVIRELYRRGRTGDVDVEIAELLCLIESEHDHDPDCEAQSCPAPLGPRHPCLFDCFPPGSLVNINVQLPCSKPCDPTC